MSPAGAIIDGVPAAQVKDRMAQLEARKGELEKLLDTIEEMPIAIHPAMGRHYRKQVGALRQALNEESRRPEAISLVRGLVDRIVLTPEAREGKKRLSIDLVGALAGMLARAAETG